MKKALEMALEALEKIAMVNAMDYEYQQWAKEYLAAIKEALAQPEQEPVCDKDPQGCWSVRCQLGNKCKNTPPQRKLLTDEQIEQMWERTGNYDSFAQAIEAAYGIKE